MTLEYSVYSATRNSVWFVVCDMMHCSIWDYFQPAAWYSVEDSVAMRVSASVTPEYIQKINEQLDT
jgi:hypothetical protein